MDGLTTARAIIDAISQSPVLPFVGLVVVLGVIFAPAALAIAGLTGMQIIELLKATMAFIIQVIHEFRAQNADKP